MLHGERLECNASAGLGDITRFNDRSLESPAKVRSECLHGSGSLEGRTRQTGLPDDRHECPGMQFLVVGDGNRDCGITLRFLHDHVAAAAPNLDEAVQSEDPASLSA